MKEQIKDTRAAILESALKLFTERGFHGTSTAQISKEASVAQALYSITFLQKKIS